jgi:hypothetical protein
MKIIVLLIMGSIIGFGIYFIARPNSELITPVAKLALKSIDTMKYSRDLAREKRDDPAFDVVINQQISAIAKTGATHVAIGTPYDEEFVPFLSRWVQAARREKLHVWFRGNFSGWEGWFDYPPLTANEHIVSISAFIARHQNLFEDGDVFTPCSECENGKLGDPRQTGKVDEYRAFLITEHNVAKDVFLKNNKKIKSGYFSMNYDVASLIMDPATTTALDGIVVIDHYVLDPTKLQDDIKTIALKSGGKVVIGEFGAPIPDINGDMTGEEQKEWIKRALGNFQNNPHIIGVNYWVGTGGSTAVWNDDGTPKPAVAILSDFFKSH